jgi:phosphoribosylformimino-5-aminoimidazole carboxamide ribotide isomerase
VRVWRPGSEADPPNGAGRTRATLVLTPPISQPTTGGHIERVRVIGVIDLRGGLAVHARGGRRDLYEPVRSPFIPAAKNGDAATLARAYREVPGLAEIYVADLDAIGGSPMQNLERIIGAGLPVMVDAGITTDAGAELPLVDGASRVVIGLETLTSFEDLARIVDHVGADRVVFSLDLRSGEPMTRSSVSFGGLSPLELGALAARAGVSAILLLDVARVGGTAGVDMELVRMLRLNLPTIELMVGGGIRTSTDLEALDMAGCDGALVGTALHEGASLLHLPYGQ